MTDTLRAAEVLSAALALLPNKFAPDLRVVDSWVADEETICIVYTSSHVDGLTGLRRQIETDVPIGAVVNDIVVCDLGEPLGSEDPGPDRDERGIKWWPGIHEDMRYFAEKARNPS